MQRRANRLSVWSDLHRRAHDFSIFVPFLSNKPFSSPSKCLIYCALSFPPSFRCFFLFVSFFSLHRTAALTRAVSVKLATIGPLPTVRPCNNSSSHFHSLLSLITASSPLSPPLHFPPLGSVPLIALHRPPLSSRPLTLFAADGEDPSRTRGSFQRLRLFQSSSLLPHTRTILASTMVTFNNRLVCARAVLASGL